MESSVKNAAKPGLKGMNAPDGEATAQPPGGRQSASLQLAPGVEMTELFACKACQDQLRRRLTAPLRRLVGQLTGLHLHVWWHHPTDVHTPDELPILCPAARRRRNALGQPHQRCATCLQQYWRPAVLSAQRGRRFAGRCGRANFGACFRVGAMHALTLVLQARIADQEQGCTTVEARTSPHSSAPSGVCGVATVHVWPVLRVNVVPPAAFTHAVALIRLILHDLNATIEARTACNKLDDALRRLKISEVEAARLHKELHQRLRQLPEPAAGPGPGSRAQKVVQDMLEYVQRHPERSIHLKELATAMKMNASYLSDLFSRTTGVTFHHFLDELRLARAKELLGDPRNRVCEVACAVGFVNANHFRNFFKAHEGVSPSEWRTSRRPSPPD